MIYIPTITYCFPACSFSAIHLEEVQAPALFYFLPAMGWFRSSLREITHGPEELGGFNIPHLNAIQGAIKKLHYLIIFNNPNPN